MSKVKICGVTDERTVDALNEYPPDFVGFVFAPSRRRITPDRAAALRERLRPDVAAVGVFVNAPLWEVEAVIPLLQMIQLHGDEDESYVRSVQAYGLPVIKAVRLREGRPAGQACGAEYVLFDSYAPHVRGGTGRPLDLKAAAAACPGVPAFWAGGLTPDNVTAALNYRPFAVDVSGGVETDGKKDIRKIQAFIRKVREYA